MEIYVVYGCGLFFLYKAAVNDEIELWKSTIDVLLPLIIFILSLTYCFIHYNIFLSNFDSFEHILKEIVD